MNGSRFDSMNVPLRAVDYHGSQHVGTADSSIQGTRAADQPQYSRWSLFMRWHLYTDVNLLVESSFLSLGGFLWWKLFCASWTIHMVVHVDLF